MKYGYGVYTKFVKGSITFLAVIILLMLLTQVLGVNPSPRPSRSRKVPVPEAIKERIAGQIAVSYGGGPFQPTLETKEDADFLLTPALLVQETLSDKIIITYPTE